MFFFFNSRHLLKMSLKIIQKINAGHLLGKKMYKTLLDKSYSKKGFSFDVQVYRALCMSTPGRYSSVGLNIAPAPTLVVPSTTSSATIVTEQEGTIAGCWWLWINLPRQLQSPQHSLSWLKTRYNTVQQEMNSQKKISLYSRNF